MNVVLEGYKPLLMYTSPASIPQIVAHIQDYLIKNPIVSIETIAQIIVQALQEHPELLNGSVIPISEDSEQSIKAYIDSLPLVDGYTKAEINLLLSGKQDTLTFDQTPTPGSSNPVTSSGIIAAMSALQTALETMINLKADAASTYTKTQVDTKLLDKANVSDVYTKNTMDAKLLEINTDISGIEDDIDGIQTDLSTQSQQIENVRGDIAIIASGTNTHTSIIYKNSFVYANDILYQANTDIPSGTSISANSNAVTKIANTFLQINNIETPVSGEAFSNYSSVITTGNLSITKYGRLAIMTISDTSFSSLGNLFDLIQNPVKPLNRFEGFLIAHSGTTPIRIWLRTDGTAGTVGPATPSGVYSGSVVYITAN